MPVFFILFIYYYNISLYTYKRSWMDLTQHKKLKN